MCTRRLLYKASHLECSLQKAGGAENDVGTCQRYYNGGVKWPLMCQSQYLRSRMCHPLKKIKAIFFFFFSVAHPVKKGEKNKKKKRVHWDHVQKNEQNIKSTPVFTTTALTKHYSSTLWLCDDGKKQSSPWSQVGCLLCQLQHHINAVNSTPNGTLNLEQNMRRGAGSSGMQKN